MNVGAVVMNVGAVVLAAGAGSRFGGGKLLAALDGRPLVRHVIDAAVAAGLEPIVLVVPPGDAFDDLDLTPALSVLNPNPGEGLSSSVRIGLRALDGEGVDAAIILPGDQPRVRADVIATLIAAAQRQPEAPFIVPRYRDDAAPNPILARRSTWRLADELAGDRGFGPVLDQHPELVVHVPVEGANPDVDTVADLLRLQGVS